MVDKKSLPGAVTGQCDCRPLLTINAQMVRCKRLPHDAETADRVGRGQDAYAMSTDCAFGAHRVIWVLHLLAAAVAANEVGGGGVVSKIRFDGRLEFANDLLCEDFAELDAPLVE